MIDLIEQLNAASRAVGSATLPAGAARTITLRRSYSADVEDVWDAITDPERISRWFLPVTGDLREGGTFQLEGNASGEIRTCDPPKLLTVTWISPGTEAGPDDSSIVNVRLIPEADGERTELELEHIAVVPPEFWDEYGPGAVGVGWDLSLLGLAAHLAGVAMGSPEEMDKDPDVRACMTASSEAWGNAFVASGADAETAARAVEGTTAFYVPPLS